MPHTPPAKIIKSDVEDMTGGWVKIVEKKLHWFASQYYGVKDNEMGRACGLHEIEEKCI
jgi:hypothetical protein